MELKEFLNKEAEKTELDSLINFPNKDYSVKVSSFVVVNSKLNWLIALLDDKYEIKEDGDEISLVEKLVGKE